MNKDYISTDSLHNYLAHARTYSHKYVKREPDGKGGWRYWYPTDAASTNGKVYSTYAFPTFKGSYIRPDKRTGIASNHARTANVPDNDFVYGGNLRGKNFNYKSVAQLRNANKASEIYREGLPDDMPRGRKNSGIKDHITSKPQSNSSRPTTSDRDAKRQAEAHILRENRIYETILPEDRIYENKIQEDKTHETVTPENRIVEQTISTITTAAKNTYNAGVNFLKKLFS